MLKLEQIQKNAAISGLEPGQVVRIVTTEPVGDNALTVYYKTADGTLRERMLFRTDEANLSLAEVGRPWAFDAPGDDPRLVRTIHADADRDRPAADLAVLDVVLVAGAVVHDHVDALAAVGTSQLQPARHQRTGKS